MKLDLEEDEAVTKKKRKSKMSRKDREAYYKLLLLVPKFKDNLQLGVKDRV